MSYFNMVCDSCGREVQGITWVNGMKFCAKCYQETFGETKKDRKIADLETKLAEMTKKYELASCPTGGLVDRVRNLELQLAEKEEELKYYETLLKRQCNECKDQDKISFAVEQLEKVRKLLNDDYRLQETNYTNTMDYCECLNIINEKIKSLKGEK